jgi:hypothetical protein
VKRAWILAVLTVASVTGLGYVHPFGNPRVEPARGLGTLLQGANLPPDAKAVLVTKCADCHSSETRWPVYARVAPGSWLICTKGGRAAGFDCLFQAMNNLYIPGIVQSFFRSLFSPAGNISVGASSAQLDWLCVAQARQGQCGSLATKAHKSCG